MVNEHINICILPRPTVHWLFPWDQFFKFEPVFYAFVIYMSVYFATLKIKTLIDLDKMPEEIFLNSKTNCWKNLH